jgi:diguanylate cyclase (GGDEF)-like protein
MSVTRRNSAQADPGHVKPRVQTRMDRIGHSDEESLAQNSCQQRLEDAMRWNDELLEMRSLLTEMVSSLQIELAKANQRAFYDFLTGLPNRRLLHDRFIQATALADRRCQHLAMLFFDINDFKGVNDKLGHEVGDQLLQQVATRMSSAIRHRDTACRYGGDEFVVLLTGIGGLEHAITRLKQLRDCLTHPYAVDRRSIRLTVSDGIAIYPGDAQNFSDLLRLSDRSMFSDKRRARARTGGATIRIQHGSIDP